MKVCQLMVDSLIERVLYLDEASGNHTHCYYGNQILLINR